MLYFSENASRSPLHLVGRLSLFLDDLIEVSSGRQELGERTQRDFYINEAVGYTPQEFLIRQRLTNAAELMRLTNLPIKTVAAQCGYPNQLHFSQAFRKHYSRVIKFSGFFSLLCLQHIKFCATWTRKPMPDPHRDPHAEKS